LIKLLVILLPSGKRANDNPRDKFASNADANSRLGQEAATHKNGSSCQKVNDGGAVRTWGQTRFLRYDAD
jgi:hypothetical protein